MSGKLLHDFRVPINDVSANGETRLRRYVITSVGKHSLQEVKWILIQQVSGFQLGDLIHFFQKILHLLVLVVVKSAV